MSQDTGNFGGLSPQHIGFVVRDGEATSRYLSSMLGLGPWNSVSMSMTQDRMIVGDPFTIKAFINIFGTTIFELIEPVNSPGSIWSQFLESNGEGIHHLAFDLKTLENFTKVVGELEARGGKKLIHVSMRKGDLGLPDDLQWCYIEMNPGGMIMELTSSGGPSL